jgi:hypothetical protein
MKRAVVELIDIDTARIDTTAEEVAMSIIRMPIMMTTILMKAATMRGTGTAGMAAVEVPGDPVLDEVKKIISTTRMTIDVLDSRAKAPLNLLMRAVLQA